MSENYLNLARKWRSKHFDEIIGQELVVRIIKNGLYKNLIFPVYLLSGQRGCGKTTTARLFASAVNCYKLESFQKDPRHVQLPCLNCDSCVYMQKLAHPDFIEIDAASHTGVDNVRQIIDAASFVPVLGKKKIYLIDEAHMLSKAAFNALLKILEEPPKTAMFFLATTDPHKILDTVKSRCFQLFFYPVALEELVTHLSKVCVEEEIPYTQEGLRSIALQTEGSVRDALNLMERVRLAYSDINKDTVFQTLGFIDDEKLLNLFSIVIKDDERKLLEYCSYINMSKFDSIIIFRRFMELIRFSLWLHSGVEVETSETVKSYLDSLINLCSFDILVNMLEVCYDYENLFSKTAKANDLLEVILIKLCIISKNKRIKNTEPSSVNKTEAKISQNRNSNTDNSQWQNFLIEIGKLNDKFLVSVFRQAKIIGFDKDKKKIEISFAKDLEFYNDILKNSFSIWNPLFKKYYDNTELLINFSENEIRSQDREKKKIDFIVNTANNMQPKPITNKSINKQFNNSLEKKLELSTDQNWVKANMITKVFPGTISYVNEKNHEEIQ